MSPHGKKYHCPVEVALLVSAGMYAALNYPHQCPVTTPAGEAGPRGTTRVSPSFPWEPISRHTRQRGQ